MRRSCSGTCSWSPGSRNKSRLRSRLSHSAATSTGMRTPEAARSTLLRSARASGVGPPICSRTCSTVRPLAYGSSTTTCCSGIGRGWSPPGVPNSAPCTRIMRSGRAAVAASTRSPSRSWNVRHCAGASSRTCGTGRPRRTDSRLSRWSPRRPPAKRIRSLIPSPASRSNTPGNATRPAIDTRRSARGMRTRSPGVSVGLASSSPWVEKRVRSMSRMRSSRVSCTRRRLLPACGPPATVIRSEIRDSGVTV